MNNRIITRWAVTLALACTALAIVSLVLSGATSLQARALATDYTVGGSCGATIQACITNPIVQAGDRILIPAGLYTESLTLDKAVSLIGAEAETTIIHAISNQRVMTVTGNTITATTVISGLTFTGGNLTGGSGCPMYCGGGLRLTEGAQPLLLDLVIANNHTDFIGGGMYADGKIALMNVLFMSNTATVDSGGLAGDDAVTLINTVFRGNSAPVGGGAIIYSATVKTSRFENNHGGGLAVYDYASIDDSRFISNTTSSHGGGLWAGGTLTLTNSLFLSNTASIGGGLEHNPEPQFVGPRPARIVNTIFAHNQAGVGAALLLKSLGKADILHTTIADTELNGGQAVVVQGGSVGITNTIIARHTVGVSQTTGAVYENYNLFFGNTTNKNGTIGGGANDVLGDPRFANPMGGNYHVISGSAAIDAGINAGVTTDIDGNPRPAGGGFDIGAYEYLNLSIHIYLPLLVKNH